MNKNKQPAFEVCALCDERYDPNSERAAFHRHPEPQKRAAGAGAGQGLLVSSARPVFRFSV